MKENLWFIRILKNKICKCMTYISKNVYIGKLGDIDDECNHSWNPPPPLYEGGVEFSKFLKKKGVQIFPIKREGLVK